MPRNLGARDVRSLVTDVMHVFLEEKVEVNGQEAKTQADANKVFVAAIQDLYSRTGPISSLDPLS